RFTGAYPNVLRILWVERDRANRLHRLFIKYWAIPRSAVVRFPNAATGRTNKERDLTRWFARSRDTGDASAHCRRTDVTRPEAGNARRIKWSVSCVNRNGAKKKRCENASHCNSITWKIHRDTHSVSESSALWFGDVYLAGEMKYRVIHRHVRFDFINNDRLFIR